MSIVLWHVTMSLDGFIAGPDDSMDWVFHYAAPNAAADEVIRSTGAVLVGRRSYDVGQRNRLVDSHSPAARPYGGAWDGPQFVLTHRVGEVPDDPTITFLSATVEGAVAKARAAAGGKNVVLIGADIAWQCLDAGLVDEIFVHLAPILLGEGIRFYGRPGSRRVELERTSVTQAGQITNLRFRVVK